MVSKLNFARVLSWVPLIENLELSVLPVPETRVKTGDVAFESASPSVPTSVPLGRFSARALLESVIRGASKTFARTIVKVCVEIEPSLPVALTVMSCDV